MPDGVGESPRGQGWPVVHLAAQALHCILKAWGRLENIQTRWTVDSVNRAGFLIEC